MTTPTTAGLPELTDREFEIMAGVCGGRNSAEIGTDIGMAEETVKTHLQRIYRKFGVSSAEEAVGYAFRNGMFPEDAYVHVQPIAFTVSCAPEGSDAVVLAYCGRDRWAVRHGRRILNAAGRWVPAPEQHPSAWPDQDLHKFNKALELAKAAARRIRTVNEAAVPARGRPPGRKAAA